MKIIISEHEIELGKLDMTLCWLKLSTAGEQTPR